MICYFVLRNNFCCTSGHLSIFCCTSSRLTLKPLSYQKNLRLSILFLKRPAIILQTANIVSFKIPSVYSIACSEVTISKREWNINRNMWTSCSLMSISSFISLTLSIIFWFCNLLFFCKLLIWIVKSSSFLYGSFRHFCLTFCLTFLIGFNGIKKF